MTFKNRDLTLTLITLFGSLSLVDVITTTSVLRQGGRELNLFLSPYVSDPALFLAIKAVGLFIIVGIALCCKMVMKNGDHVVLSTACGMSVYPALWNIHILWQGL
jgi:hypothetical protein